MDQSAALRSDLSALALSSRLLVVSDFDGTLADFSPDPYDVPVNEQSIDALKQLSELPHTNVTILSGRHRAGIQRVLDVADFPITLVGSHGSEDPLHPRQLSPHDAAELERIHRELDAIVTGIDGAYVEVKPFHRVLHFIAAREQQLIDAILHQAATLNTGDLKVTHGKNIVEYSVSPATKGTWLSGAVSRYEPTGVIFIGDDTTDEDGFIALATVPGAVSIKVGDGDTAASHRVANIAAVATLLSELAHQRDSAFKVS